MVLRCIRTYILSYRKAGAKSVYDTGFLLSTFPTPTLQALDNQGSEPFRSLVLLLCIEENVTLVFFGCLSTQTYVHTKKFVQISNLKSRTSGLQPLLFFEGVQELSFLLLFFP